MIAKLASEPESRAYITGAGVDPDRLLAETPARLRSLADVAQRIFSGFFAQCGL